ncbi:Lrp/AsnC family transcriptional regulator [Actinokineospora cianjurensis]|uniref:AsnC-like helix-turn-helix protein n=1 Tax=Actinokineospora cianjurensis TaxID=585224 RepID=A0A421BAK3_9PSEU|nr:Lrp/AsnC ligand binding domain-containing protein [Actinokineospora cianjurensis]RLK61471.1 AsnC-like helix-turn-helix protein [Actinokineospora cianjurensis]
MITAIVLISAATDAIAETAQAIADVDGVAEVYSCAGDIDLVAILRVTDHEDLARLIPGHISKIPGVLDTATHIAYRSFSSHDTQAAFDLGDD